MCICMCLWLEWAFKYFDHGANAGRNKDEQAGLLVEQIQENHNGAEASPQHWGKPKTCKILECMCMYAKTGVSFSCCLPALLDIPTMLFFCFQKLMSFLNARKSKRSWNNTKHKCIFRSLNCSITVSQGVVLGGKTDVEGSHEEGESQEVQVGVHKDSFNLIGVLLGETCDKYTRDQRARSGG